MFKQIAMAAALAVLGATVPALASDNPIIPKSMMLKPMTHALAAHVVARGLPDEPFRPSFALSYYLGGTAEQTVQPRITASGLLQPRL